MLAVCASCSVARDGDAHARRPFRPSSRRLQTSLARSIRKAGSSRDRSNTTRTIPHHAAFASGTGIAVDASELVAQCRVRVRDALRSATRWQWLRSSHFAHRQCPQPPQRTTTAPPILYGKLIITTWWLEYWTRRHPEPRRAGNGRRARVRCCGPLPGHSSVERGRTSPTRMRIYVL